MNNRSTREFVERLGHIRLEDEARARILDNMTENARREGETATRVAERSRGQEARAAKVTPRKANARSRKPRTAIVAGIAACALAASVGVVGLASLGGSGADDGATLLGGQKAFALEAYAQGDLDKEPYHTTVLTENALSYSVGGYFGHWEDLKPERCSKTRSATGSSSISPASETTSRPTRTRSEGDDAYFGIIDTENATPTVLNKYSIVDKTLTIDASSQNDYGVGEGNRYIPGIIVSLPMDDDFDDAYEAARAADIAQSEALLAR